MAAGELAQYQLALSANLGGVDDLEGARVLENAVLVDAGGVGESVRAHHRLVGLHQHPGQLAHEPAGAIDLLVVNVAPHTIDVRTQADRGGDLLDRGVAGALADAVDAALDLARPRAYRGQRVGHRHAQVVVAMHGEDHVTQRRHLFVEPAHQRRPFLRRGVAHRVGDVDRGRARLDGGGDDLSQELLLGAAGVHRRELDVGAERASRLHRVDGALQDLLWRLRPADHAPMQGRGADEGMDARVPGRRDGLGAAQDVLVRPDARQARHRHRLQRLGDGVDGSEVAW